MYQADTVYHIYNQSNSYVPIFREPENYRFFTEKMRRHLLPVADIFCYALMPDHFHWLVQPTAFGLEDSRSIKPQLHPQERQQFQQQLSQAIRSMLSGYTRAYNRRYKNRGTLFRARTKAKIVEGAAYRLQCFHYIHHNPVKDGLVNLATDYPFSSARDWADLRDNGICNYALAERVIGAKR
jgi:putative transposase